jgi:hypothetical protein
MKKNDKLLKYYLTRKELSDEFRWIKGKSF